MTTSFRLDTVLRVRVIERDRCRLALAREQQREATLRVEQDHVRTERLAVIEELRTLQVTGDWPVDRILARRQHAEHLSTELSRIDAALKTVVSALVTLRQELVDADRSVQALEKLARRHDADQRQAGLKQSERDREDTWRAA
ncbi:MAG: hypothetical protein JSS49_10630 [Planctomycetes bacterium]|nr:hypothetical protein [Planctomycetota bacterium]